jgi:hypothetical protein
MPLGPIPLSPIPFGPILLSPITLSPIPLTPDPTYARSHFRPIPLPPIPLSPIPLTPDAPPCRASARAPRPHAPPMDNQPPAVRVQLVSGPLIRGNRLLWYSVLFLGNPTPAGGKLRGALEAAARRPMAPTVAVLVARAACAHVRLHARSRIGRGVLQAFHPSIAGGRRGAQCRRPRRAFARLD